MIDRLDPGSAHADRLAETTGRHYLNKKLHRRTQSSSEFRRSLERNRFLQNRSTSIGCKNFHKRKPLFQGRDLDFSFSKNAANRIVKPAQNFQRRFHLNRDNCPKSEITLSIRKTSRER